MSQSDFQRKFSQVERPFAAGSVRGIRSWKTPVRQAGTKSDRIYGLYDLPASFDTPAVEPTGVLAGKHGGTWASGENVAECTPNDFNYVALLSAVHSMGWALSRKSMFGTSSVTPPEPEPEAKHEILDPSCTCGFWAYWTLEHAEIGDSTNIVGVIEAYGKVTIGEYGFRAEKAKILAIAPVVDQAGNVDPGLAEAVEMVQAQYPEVAVFPTVRDMLAEFPPDDAPELPPEPEPPAVGSTWVIGGPVVSAASGTPVVSAGSGPHLHMHRRNGGFSTLAGGVS